MIMPKLECPKSALLTTTVASAVSSSTDQLQSKVQVKWRLTAAAPAEAWQCSSSAATATAAVIIQWTSEQCVVDDRSISGDLFCRRLSRPPPPPPTTTTAAAPSLSTFGAVDCPVAGAVLKVLSTARSLRRVIVALAVVEVVVAVLKWMWHRGKQKNTRPLFVLVALAPFVLISCWLLSLPPFSFYYYYYILHYYWTHFTIHCQLTSACIRLLFGNALWFGKCNHEY